MKGQRGKRCNSTMRLDPREEGGGGVAGGVVGREVAVGGMPE